MYTFCGADFQISVDVLVMTATCHGCPVNHEDMTI
jgi:hypothetical protein